MSFTFRFIETDLAGNIVLDVPLTVIPDNLNLYETVGDEFFLEAGDISFAMTAPLPFANVFHYHWVAVYWNGALYNVYAAFKDYDTWDGKRNIYFSGNLESIQSRFFDNIKAGSILPQTDPAFWAHNLISAKVTINQIQTDINTSNLVSDKWGFSIGDMIENLSGKSNYYGYEINQVNHPFPIKNENNLPIVFRGRSKDTSDTETIAVQHTFGSIGGLDSVTWADLFKLALYSYNVYLRATPVINSGKLKVDIDMVSKKQADTSGAAPVTWIDYKIIRLHYQINGVRLEGENFKFSSGATSGNYVLNQSLAVSDPEVDIPTNDTTFFWADGTYASGSGKYLILNASNQNKSFHESGEIEPAYSGIFSVNDGVSGRLIFDGQKPLDKVQVGSDVVQLTKLTIDKFGVAKVDGIIL